MKKLTFIIVDIVITAAIAGGIFYYYTRTRAPETQPQPQPQTQAPTTTQPQAKPDVTAAPELKCSSSIPNVDTSDWKVYRDQKNGFEFCYPKELAAVPQGQEKLYNPVVELQFPATYSTGTNLSYAHLGVRVTSNLFLYPEQGTKIINGVKFRFRTISDGAAGSRGDTLVYDTFHITSTYITSLIMFYSNLDNYRDEQGNLPPTAPKEFDRKKIEGIFEQVMSTFKFI